MMTNFGFLLVAFLLVIPTEAATFYPPPAKTPGVSSRKLILPINCGNSPVVNPQLTSANYNPNDFAAVISQYGTALIAKSDVDPYGLCPWTVQITDDYDNFLCAGVSVHNGQIMTTSSCVSGYAVENLRVRYGDWDILNNINAHEVYANFQSQICYAVPIPCPSNNPSQLTLLSVQTPPDHDQYPHIKPICLPNYNKIPSAIAEPNCWVAGYTSSPTIQSQNVSSKIPRHAQLRRISFSITNGGCPVETWVGINGYDACVADIGTPIICYLPEGSTSSPSSPGSQTTSSPGSLSPGQHIQLHPSQPWSAKLTAVVVAIVTAPAASCTVYDQNQFPPQSNSITAVQVTDDTTNFVVNYVFGYPNPTC